MEAFQESLEANREEKEAAFKELAETQFPTPVLFQSRSACRASATTSPRGKNTAGRDGSGPYPTSRSRRRREWKSGRGGEQSPIRGNPAHHVRPPRGQGNRRRRGRAYLAAGAGFGGAAYELGAGGGIRVTCRRRRGRDDLLRGPSSELLELLAWSLVARSWIEAPARDVLRADLLTSGSSTGSCSLLLFSFFYIFNNNLFNTLSF